MAPPKDIARSYPKRGLTADVGFRSEPKFCGDGAATFPTTSDYAQTAASADLALGETYTLCAWVRSVKPSGANHVVNIGVSGTIKVSIAFFGGVSNPGVYAYNGVGSMNTTGVFESDPHTWYHIAMVIKAGAGNSQIFINGIDSTASHSNSFPLSGSPVVHIGGDYSASNGNWQGDLANVALFTSSLTEDQVRQAMRASDYASHAAIATLEAFYPLSENFNDSTGNHNATASGSPEFRPNRPQLPRGLDLARGAAQARVYTGRAVDFDGSADRITAAHYNPSGDYLTTTVWFNADTIRNQGITHNGNLGRNSFLFYMGSSNNIQFYWNDTAGDALITHQSSLNVGQWHHLAMVLDMSDPSDHQATCYIDGIAATGTRTSASWVGDNTYQFGNQYATAGWFDGKIADCRIYDVELTQDQIRELYHNPEQVLPTGVSASNLRRYYPLSDYNDATAGGMGGRYFQDMGADGEPAEDKGSCTMAFAQPVPCPQLGLQQSASRIYFDGSGGGPTGPYWSASLSTVPGVTFSLAYWIWLDSSLSAYSNIMQGSGLQHYIQTNGTISWYDGSQADFGGAFPSSKQDRWTHVVMTSTASSPYVKCYVDGVEKTATGASNGNGINIASFSVLARASTTAGFHKGFCANMAIFDDALSSDEVTELFNQGIGYDLRNDTGDYASSADLLNYWLFDDLASVVDRKGSNNLTNPTSTAFSEMASFPENASGSSIVGDFSMKRKGVSVLNAPGSGRATLAANSSLLPATGGGYTLCAFVRLQSTDNDAAVIMSTSTGTNEWGTFYEGSTNKYKIVLSNGTTNISDRPFSGTVTDSEWHHIAWTIQLDATTANGETYIDGDPDLSFTRSSFNTPPTPSDFGVGYDPGNSNKQANAAIACLRIYQSVLSANEIKQVYSSDLRLIKGLENE